MHIFKELVFIGEKDALDYFKQIAQTLSNGNWIHMNNKQLQDYILFDYCGDRCEHAELSIFYGQDTWRDGYIKVTNIVPLSKSRLSIDEYNAVLDCFYEEVIIPNKEKLINIHVEEPTSGVFDPLDYMSEEALQKLKLFCNCANKSTGSSHPEDERRWFDFICQTVRDKKIIDYDTMFNFLKDEDYWGKKDNGFIGVMGQFAWDEEMASELALEYDNYVRFLQFYIETND